MSTVIRSSFSLCLVLAVSFSRVMAAQEDFESRLARNARLASEALKHCDRYLAAWSARLDPATGLVRQNLNPDNNLWTPENSAADNFPFMIITAKFTRPEDMGPLFRKAMISEKLYAIQEHGLPTEYDLTLGKPNRREIDRLIFGAAEYAKDGLVPMVEILGPGPWLERMEELVQGIFGIAPVVTPFGNLPARDSEVNGEMLQILCRLYWLTGSEKYLQWAERVGDAYCYEVLPYGYGVPAYIWDFSAGKGDERLKLRDHGCETISGLALLYAIEKEKGSQRAASYYLPVKHMLDRILELAADSTGLLYNEVDSRTGEVTGKSFSDCWGYDYYAYYTFFLATGEEKYRSAVEHVLSNLHRFKGYPWEPHGNGTQSQDGLADAVEGALGLLSHLDVPSAHEFVDSEIKRMLGFQREDGIVEGWHGDGNFARTALMYVFYKTGGLYCTPWPGDLELAAERKGEALEIYLKTENPWQGRLCFDPQRHRYFLRMEKDYPRINAFPEWFTVDPLGVYTLQWKDGRKEDVLGDNLIQGYPLKLRGKELLRLNIRRKSLY